MTDTTTCARCGQAWPAVQPNGIGPCCWPSWYPSTAELADFRRATEHARTGGGLRIAIFDVPGFTRRGAHDFELREGIGHTAGPRGNVIWRAWDPGTEARREASALRSRAFERMYGTGRAILDRNALRAFDELDTFEPRDRNHRGTPPRLWPR